ncbi:ISAs1 family transposase [Pseudonocardia sp. NPDC046786]|uniref:ISAs1 family transposase n=1 Tax=Pseudonocardia sp. NPDC046786 TaxID=3155471 RepID=UPI003409161B
MTAEIDPERTALSLLDALARIPDPRAARGVRHGVLTVLLISACAVLAGARSFVAIAEYAHDTGRSVLDLLGAGSVAPHESAIRRLLHQLDPTAVEDALHRWAAAQLATLPADPGLPARQQRPVWALDGKSLRGARREERRTHLVSVIDQSSGAVPAHVGVDAKSEEPTAVPGLLTGLDLNGVLITADVLHTQRTHARYLRERGGHFLMTVKANQPTLLTRLRALPWTMTGPAAQQRARGHGRVETHTISVLCLDRYPDRGGEFVPHAAQAIRVIRRRRPLRPGGRWKTTTVYAITSLTTFQADPVLLARWIRGHRSIENRLHWVRAVSFDEGRSQTRTAAGPQVMAALRNLAITALRLTGTTNIAVGATTGTGPDHARQRPDREQRHRGRHRRGHRGRRGPGDRHGSHRFDRGRGPVGADLLPVPTPPKQRPVHRPDGRCSARHP